MSYTIWVEDAKGDAYFVGYRSSPIDANTSVNRYNRDPLSQGVFYYTLSKEGDDGH